ncbi:mitochondrial import inner membrane translocase subunit tim21 [Ancistrocladus abbreviatus]
MWRRRAITLLKQATEVCSTSQGESFSRAANLSQILLRSGCTRQLIPDANRITEGVIGRNGISPLDRCRQKISFASTSASKPPEENQNETRKDITAAEDPFDSPTYHIPEKPVTFAEGASYSVIILVGLGIAAAAAYGVFKELIFQPKEYKVFSKALERVQNDSQVRVRIGSPIKGYGQESRNRAARQRIPHREWKDEDGVEHVEVLFNIRGPHGGGRVEAQMFKDRVDKEWKFVHLIVQIVSPSPAQLILESYLPA